MAGKRRKDELITFKVDPSLLHAMEGVPNRSAFIRAAVLTALENACPLCKGTGVLTPNQRRHWKTFAADHSVEQCAECDEYRIVCARPKPDLGARRTRRR